MREWEKGNVGYEESERYVFLCPVMRRDGK